MDIWERLCEAAKPQYHPEDVTPFVYAHHVVCALESENGDIYTGFCIESCSGVMNLCAERVAALNMYVNSGQTVIRRLIAFRDAPPSGGGSGMAPAASSSCSFPPRTGIPRLWSTTTREKPSPSES